MDEGDVQVQRGKLVSRRTRVLWNAIDGFRVGVGVGDDECGVVAPDPLQRLLY